MSENTLDLQENIDYNAPDDIEFCEDITLSCYRVSNTINPSIPDDLLLYSIGGIKVLDEWNTHRDRVEYRQALREVKNVIKYL